MVVNSTSNLERLRKLWCSRTITVRCAPRFLLASKLLGPESRIFELLLEEEVQNIYSTRCLNLQKHSSGAYYLHKRPPDEGRSERWR